VSARTRQNWKKEILLVFVSFVAGSQYETNRYAEKHNIENTA
jgi:hypothetical protein